LACTAGFSVMGGGGMDGSVGIDCIWQMPGGVAVEACGVRALFRQLARNSYSLWQKGVIVPMLVVWGCGVLCGKAGRFAAPSSTEPPDRSAVPVGRATCLPMNILQAFTLLACMLLDVAALLCAQAGHDYGYCGRAMYMPLIVAQAMSRLAFADPAGRPFFLTYIT